MTILDPKLRLKYDRYVKIKKNMYWPIQTRIIPDGRRPGLFGTKTNSAKAEAGARAELGN